MISWKRTSVVRYTVVASELVIFRICVRPITARLQRPTDNGRAFGPGLLFHVIRYVDAHSPRSPSARERVQLKESDGCIGWRKGHEEDGGSQEEEEEAAAVTVGRE